jgi:hypothetical protein
MSAMEHPTVSQPPASEPVRADTTETGRTEKAYGNRHFKPVITPGLAKGPLIPASVSKFFLKLFRRKDAPATR